MNAGVGASTCTKRATPIESLALGLGLGLKSGLGSGLDWDLKLDLDLDLGRQSHIERCPWRAASFGFGWFWVWVILWFARWFGAIETTRHIFGCVFGFGFGWHAFQWGHWISRFGSDPGGVVSRWVGV